MLTHVALLKHHFLLISFDSLGGEIVKKLDVLNVGSLKKSLTRVFPIEVSLTWAACQSVFWQKGDNGCSNIVAWIKIVDD